MPPPPLPMNSVSSPSALHSSVDVSEQLSKIRSIQFTCAEQSDALSIERRYAPYFGMHWNVGNGGVVVTVVVVVGLVVGLVVGVVVVVAVEVGVDDVVAVVVVVGEEVAVEVGVVTTQSWKLPVRYASTMAFCFQQNTSMKMKQ